MNKQRTYWFKAKDSGLGWSTPLTWQGWLVYVAMFGAVAYLFFTGESAGQKVLGVWVPILVGIPLFVAFGEPLSHKTPSK